MKMGKIITITTLLIITHTLCVTCDSNKPNQSTDINKIKSHDSNNEIDTRDSLVRNPSSNIDTHSHSKNFESEVARTNISETNPPVGFNNMQSPNIDKNIASRYEPQLPMPISVLELCRQKYYSQLPTFGVGLEDVHIQISNMKPWISASFIEYAGTYQGALDASISSVTVKNHTGILKLNFEYKIDNIAQDGMADEQYGTETTVWTKTENSIIRWPPLRKVKEQLAQFVTWDEGGKTHKGIILFHEDRTPFTLLQRK